GTRGDRAPGGRAGGELPAHLPLPRRHDPAGGAALAAAVLGRGHAQAGAALIGVSCTASRRTPLVLCLGLCENVARATARGLPWTTAESPACAASSLACAISISQRSSTPRPGRWRRSVPRPIACSSGPPVASITC